jgi:DNA-directed RNA polymerase II subunit RPB2
MSQHERERETPNDIRWQTIEAMFNSDESFVAKHHIQTYNYFTDVQLYDVFRNNNPICFYKELDPKTRKYRFEAKIYLGGKNADRIYYGKPIIFDSKYQHYMYPNEARLRNMTYGVSVFFEIDVECIENPLDGSDPIVKEMRFPDSGSQSPGIFLCNLPIMLRSNLCVLRGMSSGVRYHTGECRNDPGGYFIIDGAEKVIISQETFANNIINVSVKNDDHKSSHICQIRSISEDPSKPRYALQMHLIRPDLKLSNENIVVDVPLVRKPVPLFILMRALGVVSDKQILQYCVMDLEQNKHLLDAFVPSIHDARKIFSREKALKFIATFTKFKDVTYVLEILSNALLPHMGVMNFKAKAYYLGYMAYRLVRVYKGIDEVTNRDSFKYKRIDTPGNQLYTLFSDYFTQQIGKMIYRIDSLYNLQPEFQTDIHTFSAMFETRYNELFKGVEVHEGLMRGFKGNWGAKESTKIDGVAQTLDRRSFNSMIAQMRKTNIDMDSAAKVVAPRYVHTSQWGFICPFDSPDGGNIGLHKYLATGAIVAPHVSLKGLFEWVGKNCEFVNLHDCHPMDLYYHVKTFINGTLVGVITSNIVDMIATIRRCRRSGLIPIYVSMEYLNGRREFYINGDGGRIMRYVYHVTDGVPSYKENEAFRARKGDWTWSEYMIGRDSVDYEQHTSFSEKVPEKIDRNRRIEVSMKRASMKKGESSSSMKEKAKEKTVSTAEEEASARRRREKGKTPVYKLPKGGTNGGGIVELLDNGETEMCYIAMYESDLIKGGYTHLEIHPSLILSILINQVNYADHNYAVRDSYSPGQLRQCMSVYHTNYMNRMDNTVYMLQYGQSPLVRSRYYKYLTNNEHPYGENIIVAIMTYGGYNVEDSIIFNKASIERGMLNITYYSYESASEYIAEAEGIMQAATSNRKKTTQNNIYFKDVLKYNVEGLKMGYNYSHLDENGVIRENTEIDDHTVLVGRVRADKNDPTLFYDESIKTHKEQSGFVDKVFLVEEANGAKMVKVRIRQHRPPSYGDKFVSRCAQKGTIGLILPEGDMPFLPDGTRPDIILNPHCMPKRMTVGQIIEALVAKACVHAGYYSDCTAFNTSKDKPELFGGILKKHGYHSRGLETLYNGTTGECMESEIFVTPTYYTRLKQMSQDKINYRARGPREALTRQTVQGRSNDGGLRVGEMERDCLIAHGMNGFLRESMMKRGDEYSMVVCDKTGCIAAYNPEKGIYLSPDLDGPLQFEYDTNHRNVTLAHKSDKRHAFSTVSIPYCLKLLMQELLFMNVNTRIITENNINQINTLCYTKALSEHLASEFPERDTRSGQKGDTRSEDTSRIYHCFRH